MNHKFIFSMLRRFMFASTLALSVWGLQAAEGKPSNEHSPLPSTQQTQKAISGTITDDLGEPIIGANVVEAGTTNGTITDLDGKFTLNVSPNATIVISYIGYVEQKLVVGNRTDFSISLKEDSQSLEEVVVVGYGVQKKVNLSGSVSNIKMDELLESRPVSNISQGLAGLAAGVQVTSSSNRPGDNTASIMIRGQGTLNSGTGPLVIIDGVEGNISSVNPQDIEDISVLKDAASGSIYGSRAANGVILITTRKGKEGSIKVDYNGYLSWESISNKFDLVSNYANYMELINEGLLNSGMTSKFSETKIDAWRTGTDALKYPNTDLMEALFVTNVGTNHNLSVSGGSDKIKFYTSFGFLNSPGIMENVAYKRYNMRTNVEANVKSWLTLGVNLNGYLGQTDPGTNVVDTDAGKAASDQNSIFTFSSATTPGMVFRAPDGRYGAMNNTEDDAQSANNNPLWRLNYRKGVNENRHLKSRFYGTLMPIEGLTLTGSFNYTFTDKIQDQQPIFIPQWNFLEETMDRDGVTKTSMMNSNYKWNNYLMDAVATYTNNVSKLNYSVMLGASQEQFRYKWFKATKQDLLDPELGAIDGATGAASASGNTVEWAMRSFFGRINLNWADKYLFEFNMRADGSSRFTRDNRWGYFPSASVAWRIDQEGFMENLVSQGLSNLKFRASYGELGNNVLTRKDANIEGNYLSQPLYDISNYILNNVVMMGVAQKQIANANLKWETTKITDIGLDFGLLNNKLTGTLDYFYKRSENVLINIPIPLVNGNADSPFQNVATVDNKGFEITLGWQDKIQDFTYFANTNFTFLKNEIVKYKGDVRDLSGASMIQEGHAYNTQYGFVVDRLVQNQADLDYVQEFIDKSSDNSPFKVTGGKRPELGDLMYKDLNGDGIVDDDDRDVIGHGPTPKFTFGVNLGAAYKGIDFSLLIQGATGMEQYLLDNYYRPHIRTGYQINKNIADGRWYEGRAGDAAFPRLLEYNDTRNSVISDFWIQNKSYVKIKNIQLGYTLPKSIISGLTLEKVRIYGSLENFFTFTDYDGLDPEVSGFAYPTSKQAVIGINVSF